MQSPVWDVYGTKVHHQSGIYKYGIVIQINSFVVGLYTRNNYICGSHIPVRPLQTYSKLNNKLQKRFVTLIYLTFKYLSKSVTN
nr:MAG TPA: hypothetical protein [Caudoviricetes sp.]